MTGRQTVSFFTALFFALLGACRADARVWLTKEFNSKSGLICDTAFAPYPKGNGFSKRVITVFTLSGGYRNILIKFGRLIGSSKAGKTAAKTLHSADVYLDERHIATLHVDDAGCVDYAGMERDGLAEWFKPKGVGHAINMLYYGVTGMEPTNFRYTEEARETGGEKIFSYERNYLWGATVSDFVRISLEKDIKAAFDLLKVTPPGKSNLVSWEGKDKFLDRKVFRLQFILRDDPFLKEPPMKEIYEARSKSHAQRSVDAVTMLLPDRHGKEVEIVSSIILNRILWDEETGKPLKPHQYIPRLALALAGELFGAAHEYLHLENSDLRRKRSGDKFLKEDIKGAQAGLAFLRRFINNSRFSTLSNEMQAEFKSLLDTERANCESLDSALQTGKARAARPQARISF